MAFWDDLRRYARFTWGLRGFLQHRLTLEEARAIVSRRMEERETNFLHLVRKGVFGYPKSPYLPLLSMAGCGMGDLESMVKQRGLEKTLLTLREAGVYVTFEEFKGREPLIRHGKIIPIRARDFDNPYLKHYYEGESGGSTGAGTRVAVDLDHLRAHAVYPILTEHAHGISGSPTGVWFGILPDSAGFNAILRRVASGNIPQKWFQHIREEDYRPALKNRVATYAIIAMGRFWGVPIPWPERVSLNQAPVIARWVAGVLKQHGKCLIPTHVSRALRVCLAAREEGLDLTGLTFFVSGEPPTPLKIQLITQAGASVVPAYHLTEAGNVGQGCTRPVDGNDIHLFKDSFALIQHSRPVPGSELNVDAFLLTSLLPSAPKLLLNVESDDYGVLETRDCSCPFQEYGFTEHLREIRSFRKLTGEGVTLLGSDLIRLIEEVLPLRFGGSPLDYQFLEEEDENGFTRLTLIISPRVNLLNEKNVLDILLEALEQEGGASNMARAVWNQAGTLRIKRMEPIWTHRGKLMPLHLGHRSRDMNKDPN